MEAPSPPGPAYTSERMVALLAAGDVDGAMELYEDDAVFVDLAGPARGRAEIRAAHERFVAAGYVLHLGRSVTFQTRELALVHWAWTVTQPDGATMEGTSAEVLRRQPDGSWLFVIDNSDGPAMLPWE